ncbi:MAG: hypothetical protein P9M13_04760 [Candidatus Ancaeobacter aquaticus]|nr:hypothetical protein [Candidatus Ancaeobacter aquaticus]
MPCHVVMIGGGKSNEKNYFNTITHAENGVSESIRSSTQWYVGRFAINAEMLPGVYSSF